MHSSSFRRGAVRLRTLRSVLLLLTVVLLVWILRQQLGQYNEIRRERQIQRATNELFAAVANEDVQNVERVIQSGAMLNTSDSRLGFTPLHHAVLKKNKPIIQSLVAAGAMLDPLSTKGSPLSVAVDGGDLELVRYLLDLGSDPNRGHPFPIEVAIKRGQLPMVELLLARGSRLDAVQSLSGNARPDTSWCLHSALASLAERDVKLELLRFLVSKGAGPASNVMPVAIADSDAELGALLRGFGAPYTVREAVAFGHLDDVRTMIEADSSLLAQSFEDYDRHGHTAYGGYQSTLLAMALKRGNHELAGMLIDLGAPVDVLVESDKTLLHMATVGGNPILVRRMLELGLDVNQPDRQGRTALHYAAAKDHVEIAELLISAGADVNKLNIWRETALDDARATKSARVEELLTSLGANAKATEKALNH